MYLLEINSQMIGIVFNINFSTPLFNQTEERTCLECFQTLSIEKCVPYFFCSQSLCNIHITDCSMLSRYHNPMFVWKYLFSTIYINKKTPASECAKHPLCVLILHKQTPIKVCETKDVKYFTFTKHWILMSDDWNN